MDNHIRESWVPSRFNVSVDMSCGRKVVFNTFSAGCVILEGDLWRRFLAAGAETPAAPALDKSAQSTLHAAGMLVDREVDEIDLLRIHFSTGRYSSRRQGITIAPTMECNLRCPYCFEGEARSRGAQSMTPAIEDAVVCYIAGLCRGKDHIRIIWLGGEPLLAIESMERISAKLLPAFRRVGKRFDIVLGTNGVLLTGDAVRRLCGIGVSEVQVTIDVPAQNKQTREGLGTIGAVLENVAEASARLRVLLRINVTRDDERQLDWIYRSLIERGLEKRLGRVFHSAVWNPVCGTLGARCDGLSNRAFSALLEREYLKCLSRRLPAEFDLFDRGRGPCGAVSRSFASIDAEGYVYKCTTDLGIRERAYTHVLEPFGPVKRNLVPWMTYDWFSPSRCRECPIVPMCAGGCPHRRLHREPGVADEDLCNWWLLEHIETRILACAEDYLGTQGDVPKGDGILTVE